MLNEAIYRSPKWLKKFADFEIHTGEDIKGEPSKSRIIKRFNDRWKNADLSEFKSFYTKIIDTNFTRDEVERKLNYIRNKHKLDESFWKKFDIWVDVNKAYPYSNFTIDDDLTVSTQGSISPILKNGKLPPVKIKSVGSFHAPDNSLESLIGSPRIVKGNFYVKNCKLKSLEGGPEEAHSYSAENNKITSLKGCPKSGHYFNFDNNLIWNLEYIPNAYLLSLRGNPVGEIWSAIGRDYKNAELFNDYDIIREDDNGNKIIIEERFEDFLRTVKLLYGGKMQSIKDSLQANYPDFYKFI